MYFDPEDGPEAEEDFFVALALLRSNDEDSAGKLRQMLDASIARKCGPSRTLAARMCRDPSSLQPPFAATTRKQDPKTTRYSNVAFQTQEFNFSQTVPISMEIDQDMTNVLVVDDRMDIPTISIPDEGPSSGDGALCQVCNSGRIGPLILLECQECQDVYHPLCHQPPVLDLDIYDPRLVWHCANCVELSDAATIVAAAGIQDKRFQKKNLPNVQVHASEKTDNANSGEQLNYFRRTRTRHDRGDHDPHNPNPHQFQLRKRSTSFGVGRTTKQQTKSMEQVFTAMNGSLKTGQASASASAFPSTSSSSSLQLRKRVGSKLTVTRTTTK